MALLVHTSGSIAMRGELRTSGWLDASNRGASKDNVCLQQSVNADNGSHEDTFLVVWSSKGRGSSEKHDWFDRNWQNRLVHDSIVFGCLYTAIHHCWPAWFHFIVTQTVAAAATARVMELLRGEWRKEMHCLIRDSSAIKVSFGTESTLKWHGKVRLSFETNLLVVFTAPLGNLDVTVNNVLGLPRFHCKAGHSISSHAPWKATQSEFTTLYERAWPSSWTTRTHLYYPLLT